MFQRHLGNYSAPHPPDPKQNEENRWAKDSFWSKLMRPSERIMTGGKGPSVNINYSNTLFQENPPAFFHFFLITILSILTQLWGNYSKYLLTEENKQQENM